MNSAAQLQLTIKTLKPDSPDSFLQQLTNSWKFFSIGYLLPPSFYRMVSSFQPCLAAALAARAQTGHVGLCVMKVRDSV